MSNMLATVTQLRRDLSALTKGAPSVTIGETFSKYVKFDARSISRFALTTGDTNPLHHDVAFAASTRFGGIIASGSHVTALLMGMAAGHFADKGVNVALDYAFRFQAPVRVDDTILMRWTVTAIMPRISHKGEVVTLEGEAIRHGGIVTVSATAHALFMAA